MNARIVHLDTDRHRAVQSLLPWYVAQRLGERDLARVQAHLAECPRCQTDIESERRLQAAYVDLGAASDAERGLAALHAKIDTGMPRQRRIPWRRFGEGWRSAPRWLHWTVAAQCAAIMLLAVMLTVPTAPPPNFHALGTPGGSTTANVAVMFRPDATERQLRHALADSGAQLVGGPTPTGAYLLSIPPEHRVATLARLRAQPGVASAQPLSAGAAP